MQMVGDQSMETKFRPSTKFRMLTLTRKINVEELLILFKVHSLIISDLIIKRDGMKMQPPLIFLTNTMLLRIVHFNLLTHLKLNRKENSLEV